MGRELRDWIRGLMKVTPAKRRAFFLLADTVLLSFSLLFSFWLRFDGAIPVANTQKMWAYILLTVAVKESVFALFGIYNITWRFFGLRETLRLAQANTAAVLILAAVFFLAHPIAVLREMPRSVLLLDFNLSLVLLGLLRISKRVVRAHRLRNMGEVGDKARVIIVGAGSAGEQIVREMLNNHKSRLFPIGFIDDDEAKRGVAIHGIKVLGTRADLPRLLSANGIDEVLIAIPSADSAAVRTIVGMIGEAAKGVKIRILPGIHDIMEGKVRLSDIKDVQVEDLLGREPVRIDSVRIGEFLKNKRILVTGAGGSIGSELARTVLQYLPSRLILLDNDDTELFYVVNRLREVGADFVPVVASIRDRNKIHSIFAHFRPDIVLHTAALKHVPILEHYPEEAVKTNILGTKILGEAAALFGVDRFVNISTDKAINPKSVMGASKRVAEEVLKILNTRGTTRFISVRFGNVLGSRGSVIPVFQQQIKNGGPVMVTHAEMKRYFMSVTEAVLLVLDAAAMGRGGEAFVLDMGKPVKIVDLAREMIKLSGLKPDVDIPIVFSGMRSGEKLFEELLGAEEGSEPTENAKIYLARDTRARQSDRLWQGVEKLIELSEDGETSRSQIISLLKEIIPTYHEDRSPGPICFW